MSENAVDRVDRLPEVGHQPNRPEQVHVDTEWLEWLLGLIDWVRYSGIMQCRSTNALHNTTQML